MNCGCEYTAFPLFSGIAPYSRFDHSMGVALIIWHFTHNMAQALAGLFHDIATPTFAHVVDFLYGDHLTQEATENGTGEQIRRDREIGQLLENYRLIPAQVENYHIYPIADNNSPKLCADRLEYTLGNSVNYGILNLPQATAIYHDLIVGTNEYGDPELMFQSPERAYLFSEAALQCSKIYVSEPDRYAMQILSELLGNAVRQGVITESDLHQTEPEIIQKLTASPLCDEWTRFRRLHKIHQTTEPGSNGKWRKVPAKKRYINPYIAGVGRTSTLIPSFREELETFQNTSQDIWLCAE